MEEPFSSMESVLFLIGLSTQTVHGVSAFFSFGFLLRRVSVKEPFSSMESVLVFVYFILFFFYIFCFVSGLHRNSEWHAYRDTVTRVMVHTSMSHPQWVGV